MCGRVRTLNKQRVGGSLRVKSGMMLKLCHGVGMACGERGQINNVGWVSGQRGDDDDDVLSVLGYESLTCRTFEVG